MKIVGVSAPEAAGVATSSGLAASHRARNSATNAIGSICSCWACGLRQYVSKKFDSDGSYGVGEGTNEGTKKTCLPGEKSRSLLDIRRRNGPTQSGISQPTNSSG